MSLPEVKLWTALRARPGGFKFRRQHPLNPYVLDFYCPAARLAIEIDGVVHEMGTNPQRDTIRDNRVATQAVRTLRIAAKDVLEHLEEVVVMTVSECVARSAPDS